MDTTLLQKIKDYITNNQEITIAVGKNPNLDQMAAALGLYLCLKSAGKKVSIACPSEPLVEISSLVGIDKVKTNFSTAGGDLVVSFPYTEGEIEKVSYTLENGFLNIIVKAGEKGLSFQEKDVEYKQGVGGATKLLFVVGTGNLSDLGSIFDPELLKDTIIINIDNKMDNQGFGDIVLVSPSSSSVSEQLANIITSLDLPLDVDIAQNLLSGISFGTDNFQNPKTTSYAFEMAALFLKKGALRSKAQLQKSTLIENMFVPREQPSPFSTSPSPMPQSSARPHYKTPTSFGQPSGQPSQKLGGFRQKQQPFLRPQQQSQVITPKSNPVGEQAADLKDDNGDEAPPDWLTPKVYKGSTLV